jgi:hypothetical protein
MPIQSAWANPEKTILVTTFGETWTLEEFHDNVDEIYNLIITVNHVVHVISDFSASRTSPAKLLSTSRHLQNKQAPNFGITVTVGANHFLKAMLNLAEKMFLSNLKMFAVDTLDEAFELIRQYKQETQANR